MVILKKETVKKPRNIPVQESNPQLLRDIQTPNSQDQQLPQNKHYKYSIRTLEIYPKQVYCQV